MEKKYFSKEQLKALKDAEPYFESTVLHQYKRQTTTVMNNKVADIYEEATGQKLDRNWSCGHCSFNAYLTIGRLYYESIEVQKELEPKAENKGEEKPSRRKGSKK